MSPIGDFARRYGFDVALVVLGIAGMLEVAASPAFRGTLRTPLWFAVPAIAILVFILSLRRRYPFAAPAAYWSVAAGISFVDEHLIADVNSIFVIGMAVSFLLGNVRDAVRARMGLAVVLGGAVTVVSNVPGHSVSQLVFIPMLFGIGWLAGFALRERADQAEAAEERARYAEREQEAAARVAVAEERARIARELHDIVAHAVSVMVLQVGAVRLKLPETFEEDKDALRRVEQAGRTALAEMRRLLGAMRQDGDGIDLAPQPGLDSLGSLAEDVGRAGLPVRLQVDGNASTLPRAIDLSAYRIVQEGLTNALKHARASRADVTVRCRSGELQIEIIDDGAGPSTSDGLGHGLVGIRERVKIYGGEMNAGTAPTGGFVLSARLPLPDRHQA